MGIEKLETGAYITKEKITTAGLWKGHKPILEKLDIELTERCNNNCLHCYINLPANDSTIKNRELSTDDIKKILAEAVSLGCLTVRLTGGEPLLRQDFEEIYLFARRSGLKVIIFTNATLITPHLARLFSQIPPLERIEITVYGMKKSSYEAVTRMPGSFEAAWRGINLLLEKNVLFVVKSALLPANKEEVDEFEAWAKTIPGMNNKPPSYSMFFDLRCKMDEARNGVIRTLRISPEEGLKMFNRKPDEYLKEMKIFCSKFASPPGDNLFSCGSGLGGGCVNAYGYLQPCMLLRHPKALYDLKKGSLKDALKKFFPKIRRMKTANPAYLGRCAECFLKGLCEQCPAKSWMENGTLDTPVEYLCEVAHAQARYLGLIKEREKAWEVADGKERIKHFSQKEPIEISA